MCDPGSLRVIRSAVTSPAARRVQAGDGVVAGSATIAGRPVFLYAQDPTYLGGSLGARHAESIVRVLRLAHESGVPSIGLVQSGGARMDEGVASLEGYGHIFGAHVAAAGWIPQVSVIYGTSAGGGCYSPALTDLVVMCDGASMFLTGPGVVKEALGEDVGKEQLGGTGVHGANGVAKLIAADEHDAGRRVRELLSYLPQNSSEEPPQNAPAQPGGDDPGALVPPEGRRVYDVGAVARAIADAGSDLELAPRWAPNMYTALARIEGRAVGIIANQPRVLAGVIDSPAAEKGAWFVDLCDRFGLPLVVLVDTPGFMPGTREEARGVIRLGAGLVRAFARAGVPKLTVVLRKAFGGAFITMNSRSLGADLVLAWPGAEVGVMAASQAVGVMHGRELAAADDAPARRAELAAAYAEQHTTVGVASSAGFVDEVVDPAATRERLASALVAFGMRRRARRF
jgi:acetyl-CoA carboxylase carboxyltransferase component